MDGDNTLDDLKRHVFFELLNLAGRVYVLVQYSDNVSIGKRGFTNEERSKGIILVFNHQMNFDWHSEGITAKLSFGATIEKCYIPPEDIISIFSPDLNVQFFTNPNKDEDRENDLTAHQRSQGYKPAKKSAPAFFRRPEPKHNEETKKGGEDTKVIEVDFTKKRR